MRWLSVPPDTSRRPWPASALGQRAGVAHDLGGVLLELRRGGLGEGEGLGGDHVVERAALQPREHRLVDGLGQLGRAEDGAAARTAERLVGGEGHDVGAVVHRVRVLPAGDEPGDVGGVEHEQRADLVGDGPERRRIDDPRVGGGAGDDDLGAVLERRVAHLVEIDALVATA